MINASKDVWMVMFTMPTCRKCKYMRPKFQQAATRLAAAGCNVKLAECNVRGSRDIVKSLDIKVAPYVKVFNTNYEINDDE